MAYRNYFQKFTLNVIRPPTVLIQTVIISKYDKRSHRTDNKLSKRLCNNFRQTLFVVGRLLDIEFKYNVDSSL